MLSQSLTYIDHAILSLGDVRLHSPPPLGPSVLTDTFPARNQALIPLWSPASPRDKMVMVHICKILTQMIETFS